MSDPTSSEVPDATLDQSIGSAASATAADTPVIRVFDSVGVFDGGQPVSIGGPKQRKLLALLAMRAGSIVSIDWLSEYLWNDDERPEATAPTIRRLAGLSPRTLAIMHGSSFAGDCVGALHDLADAYDTRVRAAMETVAAS